MRFKLALTLIVAVFFLGGTARDTEGLVQVYEVRRGDSLWEIADRFRTSVKELKRINGLRSDRIFPGQKLQVGSRIPVLRTENGPYYWHKPRIPAQKSRAYLERSRFGAKQDFGHADALMEAFDAEIDLRVKALRRRKKPLKGWRIVIDPGHGGRDPGAIVPNKDGVERPVYVVEDEYVHDIALRLYQELRLQGAEVKMTVISPNHLIRGNDPPVVTFVHQQNEVYNDEKLNRKGGAEARPGLNNIEDRVRIANGFFGRGRRKTLFVSLHADNSPKRPKGPLVIYLNRRGKIDTRSRTFAQVMQRSLDDPAVPAQIAGRNLAVLRENRAHAEILIEIRNVHDKGEAWVLRFHKRRQEDAERIYRGILAYANR